MLLTGPASEAVMVAAFLRAEIDADRWASGQVLPRLAAHGFSESIVREPDTADTAQNDQRALILGEYRGWQRGEFLFVGFPPNVEWHLAELEREEVGNVLGANYPTWRTLSGGSRLVADSAAITRSGRVPLDPDVVGAAGRACLVAQRYRANEVLDPPILVAPRSRHPLVAVEGHTRLIAWMLSDRSDVLSVILGLSDAITGWHWW